MKKSLIALLFILAFKSGIAQVNEDTIPAYKRSPVMPSFTIMVAPDSTAFGKEDLHKHQPVVFVLFSPDCEHCKRFTKDLLAKYDLLKKAHIVMASSLNFDLIKKFYEENKIADYPNISMGRDGNYHLGSFFKARTYPTVIVYDKKGNFVEKFDGEISIEKIAADL